MAVQANRPTPADEDTDDGTGSPDNPIAAADPRVMPRHRRQALRRVKRMGLEARDGDHALQLLADRGVDILNIDGPPPAPEPAPAASAAADAPAAPRALTPAEREREIEEIQRGLVRRRRRRLQLLALRLILFVILPTAFVGHYYYNVASRMFETESAFVIQTADQGGGGGGGGLGGLFSGTGLATAQDSIVVQDYLHSREAFLRLVEDHGYDDIFRAQGLDPIQQLAPDASLDDAYALYRRYTTIGYDPSEGVIRMTVVAPTAAQSQAISASLVAYAEDRVDGLSLDARGDRLTDAEARYAQAERDMLAAQQRVVDLQQQRGVLSAEAEISSQMSIINAMELELEKRRLSLGEILDNENPNEVRASALQREIQRMARRIAELRTGMTESTDTTVSLSRISAELRIAETELATRQVLLQQALEQLEGARQEAGKQVRYLSLGVAPVAPEKATWPKPFESTALAFLIFGAIYIVISLTVSVLREQVSV
jgi:capsular polysaccharide transport system permease protein